MIKSAFSQRRKVISNSLSSGLSLSKADVATLLEKSGVPQTARAEKLTLQNFADIANNL